MLVGEIDEKVKDEPELVKKAKEKNGKNVTWSGLIDI